MTAPLGRFRITCLVDGCGTTWQVNTPRVDATAADSEWQIALRAHGDKALHGRRVNGRVENIDNPKDSLIVSLPLPL